MRDQEKNNTEQLILEAAEQEFFAKGFGGARTAVIAEKAGVTHAMLHYYFRKKEYLFERIVAKNISLLAQTITAAMGNSDLPIVERLKSGIAAHFDLIAANPQLPRFFLNEVLSRPEHYHILYEGIKELLEFIRAENIPCGVLSNKGHISLSRLLKEKGWDIYFDRFQGTTDESYGLSKTIRLREFVKHFDISNAIYIGDSYTDITAARDNGLLSAGVLYGDGDRELVKREHPDYLFDTAVDLLDCFRRGLF